MLFFREFFCKLLSAPLCLYLDINHISLALPPSLYVNNLTLSDDNLTLSSSLIFCSNKTAHSMKLCGYYGRYFKLKMNLFTNYVNCIWHVQIRVVPCFVLIFYNVLLIHRLQAANWARRSLCLYLRKRRHDKEYRLTFTLIIMFSGHLMLILLSKALKYISPNRTWVDTSHQLAAVTNFMQTHNLAGNFTFHLRTNFNFRKAKKQEYDRRHVSTYHRHNTAA